MSSEFSQLNAFQDLTQIVTQPNGCDAIDAQLLCYQLTRKILLSLPSNQHCAQAISMSFNVSIITQQVNQAYIKYLLMRNLSQLFITQHVYIIFHELNKCSCCPVKLINSAEAFYSTLQWLIFDYVPRRITTLLPRCAL